MIVRLRPPTFEDIIRKQGRGGIQRGRARLHRGRQHGCSDQALKANRQHPCDHKRVRIGGDY